MALDFERIFEEDKSTEVEVEVVTGDQVYQEESFIPPSPLQQALEAGIVTTSSVPTQQGPPQDLEISEEAKARFLLHKPVLDKLVIDVKALKVVDDEANEKIIAMGGKAWALYKKIDAIKDDIWEPYKTFQKKLKSFSSKYLDPLDEIKKLAKKKSDEYDHAKIIKQREEKAKEEARLNSLQTLINEEAAKAGVETVTLAPSTSVVMGGTTRSASGSSKSMKLEWQGEVINPDEVPREYCSPDPKKIDAAIKGGIRVMAGVKIEEIPVSRLRS
jgi:hypothetical protein